MRETRSACFVLNRFAPDMVLDAAEMSLRWLHEVLGQERALQDRHAVPKLEGSKGIEIKDEDKDVVVYGDPQSVKRSRQE